VPDDEEHTAIFWGLLEQLTHRYYWGEPLTAESNIVADYWAIIWEENRACFEDARAMANRGCGSDFDTIYRFNDSGLQEFSTDGGLTWDTFPGDPRTTGTIFPPPLWLVQGGDNRCNGAISASNATQAYMEEIANGNVWDNIQVMVSFILSLIGTLVPGLGTAIVGLITAIAVILIEAGQAAFQTATSTMDWNALKCIFFCHIQQDATFTESDWQAVKQEIVDQFDGLQEAFLWNLINLAGPVGISNLARANLLPAGNCDTCACAPCDIDRVFLFNFTTEQWVLQTRETETTVVLTSTPTQDFGRPTIRVAFNNPFPNGDCCNILGWEQISGNQIFIVETVDCVESVGSAALPPTGCWEQITIFGNVGDPVPQVWRLTLGDECI
jgi:hypothetical protein